ncbi:rCG57575, partial [Rattus norvegicus]
MVGKREAQMWRPMLQLCLCALREGPGCPRAKCSPEADIGTLLCSHEDPRVDAPGRPTTARHSEVTVRKTISLKSKVSVLSKYTWLLV